MEHTTTVRVRYGEVDRMGIAYHGHYLAWFELGRTEFLRAQGHTYRDLEDGGALLMVVETGVRHLAPAHYDDDLSILARLVGARGATLRFEYEVRHGSRLLATGFTVLALVDRTGRPRRLGPDFLAMMSAAGEADAASSKRLRSSAGEGPPR